MQTSEARRTYCVVLESSRAAGARDSHGPGTHAMHPPLDREHPQCQEVIRLLELCHEERSIAKFWGACNGAKAALDRCFYEEKQLKRKKNFLKSRGRYDELRALNAKDATPKN